MYRRLNVLVLLKNAHVACTKCQKTLYASFGNTLKDM